MRDAEIPLQGGRITPGVVRVGQTVRRPPRLTAEFVHVLLEHLAAAGFDGAPRFLGTDEKGRDILSYIEGEVPAELGWHKDEVLVAAAQLIRKFHDATVGLLGHQAGTPRGLEVVCHNDLSPCNFVFRAGIPIALIDFDTAAPGTRLMDLGYAAWLWLDLVDSEIAPTSPPEEQRRRLQCSWQLTAMTSASRRSKKRLFIGRNCWLRKVNTRRGPRWRNGPAIAGIGHYRTYSACPLKGV